MLQLGDAKLELRQFAAPDEAELAEEPLEALAGPLADAGSVTAPAPPQLFNDFEHVDATSGAALCERIRELVSAFGREAGSAEASQRESSDRVAQ